MVCRSVGTSVSDMTARLVYRRASTVRAGRDRRSRRRCAAQPKGECGSHTLNAVHCDISTHPPRQLPADGETEADASPAFDLDPSDLHKRLKDALSVIGGYPTARIADNHVDHLTDGIRLAVHSNRSARIRELDGVANQIERDLDHLVAIGVRQDVAVTLRRAQRDTLRRRDGLQQHRRPTNRFTHIDDTLQDLDLPRLELGEIEYVVDESHEMNPGASDAVEITLLLIGQRPSNAGEH